MCSSGRPLSGVLAAARGLRTLTISRCRSLSDFSCFLDKCNFSPKLEELILDPRVDGETFDIQRVISDSNSKEENTQVYQDR